MCTGWEHVGEPEDGSQNGPAEKLGKFLLSCPACVVRHQLLVPDEIGGTGIMRGGIVV